MATLTVYGATLNHLSDADIDWVADTIKVALLTSSYTPDQDTHDFLDDVVLGSNEVTSANYSAGGATLANKTRGYTSGTNIEKLDADDVSWANVTFTTRYAVIYKSRGGAATADELVGYVDFGGNQTVTGGTFSVTWAAGGILTLSTT